jgi:hypothetical protein
LAKKRDLISSAAQMIRALIDVGFRLETTQGNVLSEEFALLDLELLYPVVLKDAVT